MEDIEIERKTTALICINCNLEIYVLFNKSKIIFKFHILFPALTRESIEIETRTSEVYKPLQCPQTLDFLPKI